MPVVRDIQLEEKFPGTWDQMLWTRKRPFPKDKMTELSKVSKEIVSSLWAVVGDIDFVKQVQEEDERHNLSQALINAINQRANDEAQKLKINN